jgi:plastocyanin
MRARLPLLACLAALAALAVPSQALAGPTVSATPDNVFTPGRPTVALGDSVSFTNTGGTHNVVWNDGKVRPQPNADGADTWSFTPKRAFTQPGVYRFYCVVHGGPTSAFGSMFGFVTVLKADGTVPKAPAITRASAVAGTGRVTLKFRSSTTGVVTGKLSRKSGRRFRNFGSLRLTMRNGSDSLVVRKTSSGKRLTAGSYQVVLSFSDGVSNLVTSKTLKFTLSR